MKQPDDETTRDATALQVAADLLAVHAARAKSPLDRYALARALARVERVRERLISGPLTVWEGVARG